MRRPPFRKLAALLVGVLVGLASTELGIRLLARAGVLELRPPRTERLLDDPGQMRVFDEAVGWVLRPGFRSEERGIEIDEHGFRTSHRLRLAGSERPFTVLVLGDSMSFGLGVRQEEVFSELLNAGSPDAQVVNASATGYSTAQELRALERYGPLVRPDAIVLFYTQSNDPWQNHRRQRFRPPARLEGDQLVFATARPTSPRGLRESLALFRVLDERVLQGRDARYLLDRVDFTLHGEQSRIWRLARALLAALGQEAARYGAAVLVVDVPSSFEIWTRPDRSLQARLLEGACREQGFAYLDLREIYPDDSSALFLPGDSHWSAAGHRAVAAAVAERLPPLSGPR
jgi:hypothetical protein